MTETSQTPQQGIADALHDLSDHTADLARREVRSALRETMAKAMEGGPAAALFAAAGVMALFATASAYRLSLRLLEKHLSPAAAALVATAGYGSAAAAAGALGYARLRKVPLPLPTETARQAADAVAEADSTSRREQPS